MQQMQTNEYYYRAPRAPPRVTGFYYPGARAALFCRYTVFCVPTRDDRGVLLAFGHWLRVYRLAGVWFFITYLYAAARLRDQYSLMIYIQKNGAPFKAPGGLHKRFFKVSVCIHHAGYQTP